MNHTHGPWEVKRIGNKIKIVPYGKNRAICTIHPKNSWRGTSSLGAKVTPEFNCADIALIKAAPNMLEALEWAIIALTESNAIYTANEGETKRDTITRCRAAIKEAGLPVCAEGDKP